MAIEWPTENPYNSLFYWLALVLSVSLFLSWRIKTIGHSSIVSHCWPITIHSTCSTVWLRYDRHNVHEQSWPWQWVKPLSIAINTQVGIPNYAGLDNPIVDDLIEKIKNTKILSIKPLVKALDRCCYGVIMLSPIGTWTMTCCFLVPIDPYWLYSTIWTWCDDMVAHTGE